MSAFQPSELEEQTGGYGRLLVIGQSGHWTLAGRAAVTTHIATVHQYTSNNIGR
jgi:hypothetical protein